MVEHPGDYKWSSYRANAFSENTGGLTPHNLYLGLSNDKDERVEKYRQLFSTELDKDDLHTIRKTVQFSMPVGDNRYVDKIEQVVGGNISYAKRGRPIVKEELGVYLVW